MNSVLAIVALAIFAYIGLRSKEHALAILIFSLPLYLVRFAVGPIPSTLLEAMILILFVLWVADKGGVGGAWRCVHTKIHHVSRPERFLHLSLFLFVLSATVSVAVSPDPRAALGVWRAYFIEPALFFIVFLDTVKTPEQVRRMITAGILSGVCIALVAVYQKLTGWNIPAPWLAERRVTSIYPYPNAVGLYLAPIAWLAIGRARELMFEKKHLHALGASLAVALCIAALSFSKTEGALVALAVTAIGAGVLWSKKTRIVTVLMTLIAVCVLSFVPALSGPLTEKLLLRDWSGSVRIKTWKETATMLLDHPLTGAGLAGYQTTFAPYHAVKYIEIFLYPHTIIFNFWSEIGLHGLVSFFLVCVALFTLAIGIVRKAGDNFFVRVTTAGLVAALVTILVHGLVDVPYFKNDLAIFFWFLAGSIVALHRFSIENGKN